MIVVAIVGVLAALAIYGVRKYVLNAKTAEARNTVGQIAKAYSSSFNRERADLGVMPFNSSAALDQWACGPAPAVPGSIALVKGQKYQSSPTDWAAGGWECMHFTMEDPQYYQYALDFPAGTPVITARGDLDGDDELSTFTLPGDYSSLGVIWAPNIAETQPDE
jgi:type IV pilus assembly protein PilA